jgi:hypothetical protein
VRVTRTTGRPQRRAGRLWRGRLGRTGRAALQGGARQGTQELVLWNTLARLAAAAELAPDSTGEAGLGILPPCPEPPRGFGRRGWVGLRWENHDFGLSLMRPNGNHTLHHPLKERKKCFG